MMDMDYVYLIMPEDIDTLLKLLRFLMFQKLQNGRSSLGTVWKGGYICSQS